MSHLIDKQFQVENCHTERLVRLSRQGLFLLAAMLLISLLLHVSSFYQLSTYNSHRTKNHPFGQKSRVILKYPELKPEDPQISQKEDIEKSLPILEAPQIETERPKTPSHLGQKDHIAKNETKVKRSLLDQDKDPGLKGSQTKKPTINAQSEVSTPDISRQVTNIPQKQVTEQNPEENNRDLPESKTDGKGKMVNVVSKTPSARTSIGDMPFNFKPASTPRNSYEKLLAFSSTSLNGQVNAGYQDYIEDDVEVADAIDINTQEYRFVGYTSAIRKGLQLVWTYPAEAARRGIQGSVDVVFGINPKGEVSRIRVIKSSGHKILDNDIVEALQLASPFAPPPEGFIDPEKKIKLLRGRFQYILSH